MLRPAGGERRKSAICAHRAPAALPSDQAGRIAQRQAGISNGNRRNELHQIVFRGTTGRARQELVVGQLLADPPMHRIAQAFLHPVMVASYATLYC